MNLYPLLRDQLFRLDAEAVHHLALHCLKSPVAPALCSIITDKPRCQSIKLWDLQFSNPIGLAAGFDKNAEAIPAWQSMRFGFVEVGTVTPKPQVGNPRPRVRRFPQHQALVNSMGFPNDGLELIARRLQHYRRLPAARRIPVGVNIGKAKQTSLEAAHQDYCQCLRGLHAFADYFVVNISSPNTPNLRQLQNESELRRLLLPIRKEMDALNSGTTDKKQLLFKIAPDLDEKQIEKVAQLGLETGMDGIVATNTTLDHSPLQLDQPLPGGLSGHPLREKSTAIIRLLSSHLGGRIPIIGCGGVFTSDDVKEKMDAGATLVQIYTSFVYLGPRSVNLLLP